MLLRPSTGGAAARAVVPGVLLGVVYGGVGVL